MLFPKKIKFRKWQKMRTNSKKKRVSTKGIGISFGEFGMRSTDSNRINSNQIEAARRVIVRHTGKTAKVWIRVFPDRPYTRKASEVPMGKGKGDPAGFEVEVLPGKILFEIAGVSEDVAKDAFKKASKKLPIKTKFATRATIGI